MIPKKNHEEHHVILNYLNPRFVSLHSSLGHFKTHICSYRSRNDTKRDCGTCETVQNVFWEPFSPRRWLGKRLMKMRKSMQRWYISYKREDTSACELVFARHKDGERGDGNLALSNGNKICLPAPRKTQQALSSLSAGNIYKWTDISGSDIKASTEGSFRTKPS